MSIINNSLKQVEDFDEQLMDKSDLPNLNVLSTIKHTVNNTTDRKIDPDAIEMLIKMAGDASDEGWAW